MLRKIMNSVSVALLLWGITSMSLADGPGLTTAMQSDGNGGFNLTLVSPWSNYQKLGSGLTFDIFKAVRRYKAYQKLGSGLTFDIFKAVRRYKANQKGRTSIEKYLVYF